MSESIWNDPRITAYVLDELPRDERHEFEREMNSNAELAAAVAEAGDVTSQLGELYLGEATPPLDASRREAIFAGDAASTVHVPAKQTSSRIALLIMATAASLLILLGLAPWMAERASKVAMENSQQTPSQAAVSSDLARVEQQVAESIGDKFASREVVDALVLREQVAEHDAEMSEEEISLSRRLGEKQSLAKSDFGRVSESAGSAPMDVVTSELDYEQKQVDYAQVEQAQSMGNSVSSANEVSSPEPMSRGEQMSSGIGANSVADPFGIGMGQPAELSLSQEVVDASGAMSSPESEKGQGRALSVDKSDVVLQKSNGDDVHPFALGSVPTQAGASGPAPAAEWSIAAAPTQAMPGAQAKKSADAKKVESRNSRISASVLADGTVVSNGTRRFKAGLGTNQPHPLPQAPDYGGANPDGVGPGKSGDQFDPITDNAFKRVDEHPLSTFSVDVDTASYSKTRDFLMRANRLPGPDAVRIEELVNYFDYDYAGPDSDADHPFAARALVTGCPWNQEHRLARIAIKGKEMDASERPKCNLVFLLDTSGSMNAKNKLPLVLQGMQMLIDRLNKKDRVAIAVYAGSAGLVLDSTKVGKNGKEIKNALTRLSAGGSTNGGAGIELAYRTARDNFISDGVNRVILCTDGDFNVGTTGTDALVRMVEREAKGGVFLSVLGFGMGNHNDAMLEKVSGRGNGNYAFIDSQNEARKVLVDQTNGTLVTIAKDVKLQIEFNPTKVSSYRLIGYENRILAKEDFNDDKKDAGEIGAGHEVTALYEIVPAGIDADPIAPKVDPLKYQKELKPTDAADSDEMLTVKLRYKQPDGDKSTLVDFPVVDDGGSFDAANAEVRFAAAVAGFGMQLRRSEYKGEWTLKDVLSVARGALGADEFGLRAEFVEIAGKAAELMGHE